MYLMANPWERLAHESQRAFSNFQKYRSMGAKRSIRRLAQQENIHPSVLAEQSSKYRWQDRVSAWDAHLDKESQCKEIEQVHAMKRRQISLALRAQKAAAKGLRKLVKQMEAIDIN